MAWKYKRWKIKWNPKKRKFIKKKRNRKLSREAHLRAKMHPGAVRMGLRKARLKGRLTMKKNKAMGMYKKLQIARKRYKNILKSGVDMELFFDQILNEEYTPEIELDYGDLDDIVYALEQIKRNIEFEDKEEGESVRDNIDGIIERIKYFDDLAELDDSDHSFLGEIISIIEEFGEEAGLIPDDDDDYDNKEETIENE